MNKKSFENINSKTPSLAISFAEYIVENGQEQAKVALANLLITLCVTNKQSLNSIKTNNGKVTVEISLDNKEIYNPIKH